MPAASDDLLLMAGALGNMEMQRLRKSLGIQAAASVSAPEDDAEVEARQVASRVMRAPGAAASGTSTPCPACASGGGTCPKCAEESKVMRAPDRGGHGPPSPPSNLSRRIGPGTPIASGVREFFEPRFGRDFGAVRVHEGADAASTAAAVHARAFTVGSRVVLGRGAGSAQHPDLGLFAHELAHVAQQGFAPPLEGALPEPIRVEPDAHTVHRDPTPDPGKYPDDKLAKLVEEDAIDLLTLVEGMGGLKSLEAHQPESFKRIREKLAAKFGEDAVSVAYDNDERIMKVVLGGHEIYARLVALEDDFWPAGQQPTPDQMAAWEEVRKVADEYDHLSYPDLFKRIAKEGPSVLDAPETFLAADHDELVAAVKEQAEKAQAKAAESEANRAEWTATGAQGIGREVASRENILWWNQTLFTAYVLDPGQGSPTEAEAIAWARISGRSSAVLKIGDRFYAYALNGQFSFSSSFLVPSWEEGRSTLVPAPRGTPATLITSDGYVLRPSSAIRYRGGAQTQDPESYARGTATLLGKTDSLSDEQALALFKTATLDLLMLHLAAAQRRLKDELSGIGLSDESKTDYGGEVKRRAEQLRGELARATGLINKAELTEDDELDLMDSLETIGRIQSKYPGAALMVKSNRDPASTEPVKEGDIENASAGKSDLEVAADVTKEFGERLEHIDLIRRHFYGDIDATLSLGPLHPAILPFFSTSQQIAIRIAIGEHTIAEVAGMLGIGLLELLLVIGGGLVGGPVGAGLAAGGVGLGVMQAGQQLDEAERMRAGAALDVPGGFALNSEEAAASATRWAYISLALSVVDVGEFASGERILSILGRAGMKGLRGVGSVLAEGVEWAARKLGLPADVLSNLTMSAVARLRSLPEPLLERLAALSPTLQRILLGCASPCKVDLVKLRAYLEDPARAAAASGKVLETADDVLKAIPKEMRAAVADKLKRHPSLLAFIRKAGLTADDLSPLANAEIMVGRAPPEKMFTRYLNAVVPAKVSDWATFKALIEGVAEESGAAEIGQINAMKGPMFENYGRMYKFRRGGFGRIAYDRTMIPALEAARESDGYVARGKELWDFKFTRAPVPADQVRDYRRILAFEEARGADAEVTSINYLFQDRDAALANARLLDDRGFRVWYLGPSGQRVQLRWVP